MAPKSKATTSSSEYSFSNSDTSSSSNSSSGRVPFFERYAQLMPKTTTSEAKATVKEAENEKDELVFPPKKQMSPITSPEPSPLQTKYESSQRSQPTIPTSKSMPFSNFTALGIASQRREALTRITKEDQKLPSSTSAASGLDKLIAREHEELSRSGRDNGLRNLRAIQPEPRGAGPTGKSSSTRARTNEPSVTGLEDLMGDLMAEMEKKAEQSSEEYQKRTRQPAIRKIQVPETTPKHSSPDRFGQHHYEVDTPRKYPSAYPDDTPKFHTRQPSDPSTHSPTPSSPGIRPSDSISQLGYTRSPSPKLTKTARVPRGDAERMCQRCMEAPIRHVKNPKTDEARLCSACYAEVYLPKCRKCSKPIERGAVTDRVGKVLGKYHASCFNCFQCNAPFPNGEFYVWERRPVCSKHYHRLAGTTCCNQSCGRGIEGPCVSLFLDGSQTGSVVSDDSTGSNPISNSARRKLYHPEHFSCSRRGCTTSLHEFHFVVNKQPWCERHALQEEDSLPRPLGLAHHYPLPPSSRDPRAPPFDPRQPHPSSRMPPDPRAAANQPPRRMERRRTIIQNVRSR
ncbi:hypothetical protein PTTG_06441 [Puccinia triticina 1-1 BBBD Race 1]|uniref:LIM zinc-binding domain-containing protein n=2 Tax=Puccinia triticina TaxID=208348 RepID=A0A180GXH3_PUCT1|nr:uncharacterized protein PtA15_6A832 [Puccinia triticina]OAV97048.1 hypothetical protein PTTG_06441 [Puccinia triticina 1-1 BBBD Race 1]WAQ86200.1 hypothetical protein PtA15_6A832 [Puccinia triticina]